MPGYVKPPHMRHGDRFVSPEKRKDIAYKQHERQERQGKKVIKLHSAPPGERYSSTFCNRDVLDFLADYGHWPTEIRTPYYPRTSQYGFSILHEGEWIVVWCKVVHAPAAEGIHLA